MADSNGSIADAESLSNLPCCKEGPVLTLMTKRLRALKKKFNRILQIEESKGQGKAVNKEQEEVLKTKIAVAALIDEYEKLRRPLAAAVKEELAERDKELMAATLRREEEEESAAEERESESHESSRKEACEVSTEEVRRDLDGPAAAVCNGAQEDEGGEATGFESTITADAKSHGPSDRQITDLLKLLYFAQLFDVRSQREASSLVWTKVHERSSCLSYDFVTEDSTSPLLEGDLDALSLFGSLVTSRPPNATLSHKDALQQCVEHAILWLQNSDRPIRAEMGLSYSHLRERLNRILSSEYFTMTPELQTVSQQTAAAAATAAGQYASQMLMHEASPAGAGALDSEGASIYLSHEDPSTAQQLICQTKEGCISFTPASDDLETPDPLSTVTSAAPYVSEAITADEIPKFGSEVDANETCADTPSIPKVQEEQEVAPSDPLHLQEPQQPQEQQHLQQSLVSNVSVGPRGYQGPKGGGRGLTYGTGGRGRGYMNGRGRGGRGGYANGRNGQYYDQGGGYYPRNYYGRGGGRGMRGGGSSYNGHANGQATSVTVNAT